MAPGLAEQAAGGSRATAGPGSAARGTSRSQEARCLLPLRPLRHGSVALVLIAAAVAAAVIVATDKATGVKATEVAGDSVDKVVEEFKELVKKNTE